MMSENFSVQFKLGVAGIISSLIWISVKFGLFSLSVNEWLSLCGIIFSFVFFYHYLENESLYTLISVYLFFYPSLFFIYFNQNQMRNSHLNFDFSLFVYVFTFSLGAFFFFKSFLSPSKLKLIFVSVILSIGTVVAFIWNFQIKNLRQDFFSSIFWTKVEYIITISLILILLFPIKNILNSIREIKQKGDDVPLS